MTIITIDDLWGHYHTEYPFQLKENILVIDVRSEAEYAHAHIPQAVSIPIFDNEERKIIGTAYKQESREQAIKIGLDFFGKKMTSIIQEVEKLVTDKQETKIIVHCWRGGMRSAAFTWLLSFYGFQAIQLADGYKSYRRWALAQFEKPYQLTTIGGNTGSAKTEVLQALRTLGMSIIDLEDIACHRGSAFGAIEGKPQPSQEQFENELALHLHFLLNKGLPILLEDESRRIGSVNIPAPLWEQMRQQPIVFLEIDFAKRLSHIVSEYAQLPLPFLINNTDRIRKRLGGDAHKMAIEALVHEDYNTAFGILLAYYDKYYAKGLHSRNQLDHKLIKISSDTIHPETNAHTIYKLLNNLWNK